jgi:membrane-anchored glycerophosphoryl diester phosphodiesterase (GDPDase)
MPQRAMPGDIRVLLLLLELMLRVSAGFQIDIANLGLIIHTKSDPLVSLHILQLLSWLLFPHMGFPPW